MISGISIYYCLHHSVMVHDSQELILLSNQIHKCHQNNFSWWVTCNFCSVNLALYSLLLHACSAISNKKSATGVDVNSTGKVIMYHSLAVPFYGILTTKKEFDSVLKHVGMLQT